MKTVWFDCMSSVVKCVKQWYINLKVNHTYLFSQLCVAMYKHRDSEEEKKNMLDLS